MTLNASFKPVAYKYSSQDFYNCIFLWIISEVLKSKTSSVFLSLPLQCKRSKEQRDALLKRLWGIYIAGGSAYYAECTFSIFFVVEKLCCNVV